MAFNYGDDVAPVSTGGGSFKQAAEGDHTARVAGFLHLGMYEDVFKGTKKPAAPFICVVFELKDEEDFDDEGNPLTAHMRFPLKKGEKSKLTAFMKTILTGEEFKLWEQDLLDSGFDELIGRAVNVKMTGSKTKDDEGNPKYTNLDSISSMPTKFANMVEPLTNNLGHVSLGKYTEQAMKALPTFLIYDIMEKSANFPGSQAEQVLLKLRKENPEFATKKSGDNQSNQGGAEQKQEAPVRQDLDGEQEF